MMTIKNEGSSFESFLREEGIRAEVDKIARRRVRAWRAASKKAASPAKGSRVRRGRARPAR